MSLLSDYLNAQLGPHARKAQLAEALHGVLDRSTVYKYLAGTHPQNPPEQVLQAFANALPSASITDLRAAIRVPVGTDIPWTPPPEANRLTPAQRQAIEQLIKSLVGSPADTVDNSLQEVPRPADLAPDQTLQILVEVKRLRDLGRDDLADAVLEKLSTDPAQTETPHPRRPH